MTERKIVAVLVATYNGQRYLKEQLDSLLNQDYSGSYYIYIHDDGSTDETLLIIQEYVMKHPQKIIYIDGDSQKGAKGNFLYMMKTVEASYYMFSDQDDVWKVDKISKSIELLISAENQNGSSIPSLVFSDLEVVDSNLETLYKSYLMMKKRNPYKNDFISLLRENVAAGCTIAFNYQLRNIAKNIDSVDNISMHDLWLIMCASLFGKVAFLDEATILYRQHPNNVLGAKKDWRIWVNAKINNIRHVKQIEQSKKGIEFTKGICKELTSIPLKCDVEMTQNDKNILEDICSENKAIRVKSFYKYRLIKRNPLYLWKLILV